MPAFVVTRVRDGDDGMRTARIEQVNTLFGTCPRVCGRSRCGPVGPQRTEIGLRCARCNTAGSLLLDDHDPDHRRLLEVWREARATGDRPVDDPKASR